MTSSGDEQSKVDPATADASDDIPPVPEAEAMGTDPGVVAETGGADSDEKAPAAENPSPSAAAAAATATATAPEGHTPSPGGSMAAVPSRGIVLGGDEETAVSVDDPATRSKAADEPPPSHEDEQDGKAFLSYTEARKAGLVKCKCKRPICPNCVSCTHCTCQCPGNTRSRRGRGKGKKKSTGGGGGRSPSGGGDASANRPPKKKLRVAEIAAIETHDEIIRRLRRTDRTVLVPVAADGTDAYTASCITDVLTRFGATVLVAKVPECSFDMESPAVSSSSSSHAAATKASMTYSSPPRNDGSSPTRRSAAATATATESTHDDFTDLDCKTSGGGSARIVADMTIQAASRMDWDMIVLPGGVVGCKHLRSSETLMSMLKRHRTSLKPYGAIGEAPAIVLASPKPHLLGLIDEGRGAACLPDPILRSMLPAPAKFGVVVQGNLVTAAGPGSALDFALALGEQLYGPHKTKEISEHLLVVSQKACGNPSTPLQEVIRKGNGGKSPTSNGQDCDDYTSKYKNCVLSEEDTFMKIVWPALDTLGWSLENKVTGDGTVFCPPGVKRDAKGFAVLKESSGDDGRGGESDGDNIIYCLQTKLDVVDFVQQRPISYSSAQYPVSLFTQCMERADDLVNMGRITLEELTLDSVISEVKQNGNIAEAPLFDEFIWPQLFALGWTIEDKTRHRPESYVAPHLSTMRGADRFKQDFFAPTRKDLINFLYEDDVWGSKDEVLKVLDVFQACVAVGNEMAGMGLLIDKRTPLWLYLKARERRPALPWLSSHLGPEKEMEGKSADDENPKDEEGKVGEESKLGRKADVSEADLPAPVARTDGDESRGGLEKI